MDPKHLTAVLVSAILGVILLATVVAPIVSDGQTTVGNPITKSNGDLISYEEYGQYWDEDLVFTAVSPADATTAGDTVYSVNGEAVNMRGPTYNSHIILTSDNVILQAGTSGNTNYSFDIVYTDEDGYHNQLVGLGKSATITYSKSAGTINVLSEDYEIDSTIPATYCFSVSNTPDYEFVNNATTFPSFFITDKEINGRSGGVIDQYSASFTIGEATIPAAIISDIGGTRVVYDHTLYEGELKAELVFEGLHIADGTTDIYTGGTPKFVITTESGDEVTPDEVTPSRSYIISEVTGHATSGSLYSMLGIIPIVVAIGIVLGIVSMAIVNRYD